jgi:hypothetical protein
MPIPRDAKYRELIARVTAAKKKHDSAEDDVGRLTAICEGLQAHITFWVNDPEMSDKGLLQLLSIAENALWDRSRGAKPALLEHPLSRGEAPTETAHEIVETALAWELEKLTRVKFGTEHGAKLVAETARKAGLTDVTGSAIRWKRIDQWRKDIRTDIGRELGNSLKAEAPRKSAAVISGWKSWEEHDKKLLHGAYSNAKRETVLRQMRLNLQALASTHPTTVRPERHRTETVRSKTPSGVKKV